MAHTAASMQSPVTPSRQLGAARGPRRTPASRSKKPYARPKLTSSGDSQADYQSQASPGFLKGMRSLVSRLWGTTIKPSNAAPERESKSDAPKFNPLPVEMHAEEQTIVDQPPKSGSAATFSASTGASAAAAVAAAAVEDTPMGEWHAATVGARARSRRPTAESVFAPSPFAYNKRLAAATPLVANLRDVQRVKAESPALSRRHSSGRIDPRLVRLPSGSQVMTPRNDGAETMRFASQSNARRLLDTLGSIHTPILDARSRSAGGQASGTGLERHASALTVGSERSTPMPLRRLPVSLLALSDTPDKAPHTPLAESAESLSTSTLRRSGSLRAIPRRQATAPSLARTIQLQQARKVVAERLIRSRTADVQASSSDAGSDADDTHAFAETLNGTTGHTRMREDDTEDIVISKRRRGIDGDAINVSEDAEMADEDTSESRRRVERLKRTHRRHLPPARRATSAVDAGVKWRFSARFDTASDEEESSSENDEDREALAAKVPLSKIRGGELIGLSLRSSVSGLSSAVSSASSAVAVRPTGFGSTRTPVPIVSEAESAASSVTAPSSLIVEAAPAPAPVVATPSLASVTSKPLSESTESKAESTQGEAEKPKFSFGASAPAEAEKPAPTSTAADTSAAPAFSFGGFATKKPDAEEEKALATSEAPKFSFGTTSTKRSAEDSDKPAADKPAAPMFSFGTTSAKRSADDGDKPAAPTFSFGTTATKRSADESDKPATETPAAPKFSFGTTSAAAGPAPEKMSTSTFSFGSSKPETAADSTTTAAKPTFSFGTFGAAATPASSGEVAKPADTTAAPVFKFGLGAQSTSAKPEEKKEASASSQLALPGASTATPSFSFGSGSGASGVGLTAKPLFGASSPAKATPAEASSTTNFSFGKSSESGTGFTFGGSKATFAAPTKTVDLTTSAAGTSTSSAAPSMFSGFGSSSAAPEASMDTSTKPGFSFNSKPSFGTATAAPASKPPPFGSFGAESAAKKPAFTFGSVNTPSAASFESTTVLTPAAPSFGTTPAAHTFGAPAATPSSFSFAAASSPAATPSTSQFSFGAKPPVSNAFGAAATQSGNAFGNQSTQSVGGFGNQSTGGFGAASTQSTGGFGNQPSSGFGAASTQSVSGFGNPSTQSVSGFGTAPSQSMGGLGNQSAQSTSGFGASSNTGTPATSGFGGASGAFNFSSNTTGFGQASNATPATGGFGSSVGGFNAASNNEPQSAFGQNNRTVSGSFQFGSGGGGFGGSSAAASSGTPFTFGSNTQPQTGGPFQFSSGVANPGGMSLGRVPSGSNASTSSLNRKLARPRSRRLH
ncbi:hypothetical protein GGH96_002506 [Coemansia sp. RSA 1972]|nr:hypothetical protein GGH96_002506 [Coemansia sp. RSA 1972]